MQEKTDAELIQIHFASRDKVAFAEIVSRHIQMVYRVCFRILGNLHDAEDATQATFVVLLKMAAKIRRKNDLTAWLHGVARNISRDALRTKVHRAQREKEASMLHESRTCQEDPNRQKVFSAIDQELGKLSGIQRQAVMLRHLKGHSERASARIAGCSVSALNSRANEGIAKLRKAMAKHNLVLSAAVLVGLLEAEAKAAIPQTVLSSAMAVPDFVASATAGGTTASNVMVLAEGGMRTMVMRTKAKLLCAASVIVVIATSVYAMNSAGILADRTPERPGAETQEKAPFQVVPVAKTDSKVRGSQTRVNATQTKGGDGSTQTERQDLYKKPVSESTHLGNARTPTKKVTEMSKLSEEERDIAALPYSCATRIWSIGKAGSDRYYCVGKYGILEIGRIRVAIRGLVFTGSCHGWGWGLSLGSPSDACSGEAVVYAKSTVTHPDHPRYTSEHCNDGCTYTFDGFEFEIAGGDFVYGDIVLPATGQAVLFLSKEGNVEKIYRKPTSTEDLLPGLTDLRQDGSAF